LLKERPLNLRKREKNIAAKTRKGERMSKIDKNKHPWDDNLPKNKKYIKKFYKKTEKEIKKLEGEGKIK